MIRIQSLLSLAVSALLGAAPVARAEEDGHAHHNHAAVFVGATVHDSHAYPTVGVDYERLFNAHVGAVLLGELVLSDPMAQIAGLGLAYHPIAPIKIAALGGVEHADGHAAFLVRGNLEYAIHAGAVTVSPSASVDYVDEEIVYVLGAALGMGF